MRAFNEHAECRTASLSARRLYQLGRALALACCSSRFNHRRVKFVVANADKENGGKVRSALQAEGDDLHWLLRRWIAKSRDHSGADY
jgi:hypothetical protein